MRLTVMAAMVLLLATPAGAGAPDERVGREVTERLSIVEWAPVVVALRPPLVASSDDFLWRYEVRASQDRVLEALDGADLDLLFRWSTIPGFAARVRRGAIAVLASHPDVLEVDLDVGGSAHLAQSLPLIGADLVHSSGYTGEGVMVAVLDSGVPPGHPDLASKIVAEQCFCVNSDGTGCCSNGSTSQSGTGAAADGAGHGSNVTGIIAAEGVLSQPGMAPGVDIVAVKVIDDLNRFSSTSQVMSGLDWVLTNWPQVRVINMSLGTDALFSSHCDNAASWTRAFASAFGLLRSRGGLAFVSSGNEGSSTQMAVPACISGAVSVGAVYDANVGAFAFGFPPVCTDLTTAADQITCFTNSNGTLDLLGPGAAITSVGRFTTSTYFGTSQASPHAAGLAALLIQIDPQLTADQIETIMKQTGVPMLDSRNAVIVPRINAAAAAAAAAPEPPPRRRPVRRPGSQ